MTRIGRRTVIGIGIFGFGWWAGAGLAPAARAGTLDERIVSDPATGLALYGYDPVEYFLSGAVRPRDGSFEARHEGFMWRFRNGGNQAAFVARPDVYVPAFGGYDPVGIAEGIPSAGHPEIFVLHRGRLVLFHAPANRDAFMADPAGMMRKAEAGWPKVLKLLSR